MSLHNVCAHGNDAVMCWTCEIDHKELIHTSVESLALLTWGKIPESVVESMALKKCFQHYRSANVQPPDCEQWENCRHTWIESVHREHARGRAKLKASKSFLQTDSSLSGSNEPATRAPGIDL